MFKKGDKVVMLAKGTSFTGLEGEVIQTPTSKNQRVWVQIGEYRVTVEPEDINHVCEV
jgi:hypothetical protein